MTRVPSGKQSACGGRLICMKPSQRKRPGEAPKGGGVSAPAGGDNDQSAQFPGGRGARSPGLGSGTEPGFIPAPSIRRGKRCKPKGFKAPPRHLRVGRWEPLPRPGSALEIRFAPLGFSGNVRFRLICLYYFSWVLLRCFRVFLFSPTNFGARKYVF